jgi:hypothetical protein
VDIWRRARKIFQRRPARVVKRETDELSASSKKKFARVRATRSSNFDAAVAVSLAAGHFPEKMPSHERISYHRAPLGL